jgi:hypothetical protein
VQPVRAAKPPAAPEDLHLLRASATPADYLRRYFVQPLAPRDLDELGRILDTLIQANQDQPG